MFASLGRDGVAASISVTRKRTQLLFHRPSRHISHSFLLAPSASLSRHDHLTLRVHQYRLLSTPVPPPTEKPAVSNPSDPVPPGVPPVRKHKVELRPGPLKPQKSSAKAELAQQSKSSTAPEHVAASEKTSASPSSSSSTSTPEPGSSVIRTARQDYEAAAQHGILAPPPEGSSRIYTLWHQAKEYFKFYLRGLKLINTHRILVKEMRARAKTGGPPLSRWESRFIRTYKQDILKLVPFLMIIIVLEEAIPLVVVYAPFLLPSTCILPSQRERIESKRREKQIASATAYAQAFEEMHKRGSADGSLSVNSLLQGSASTSTSGILGLSTLGPAPLLRLRIRRHLSSIVDDDAQLIREEMGAHLTPVELREALEERGILTDGLTHKQQQSRLEWWLSHLASSEESKTDPIRQRVLLVARSGASRF